MMRYVAAMLDDYVISGLTKRRATLLGEIMQIEQQRDQKLLDLNTLDAAIKMFDADYPIEIIKPKKLYRCSAGSTHQLFRNLAVWGTDAIC